MSYRVDVRYVERGRSVLRKINTEMPSYGLVEMTAAGMMNDVGGAAERHEAVDVELYADDVFIGRGRAIARRGCRSPLHTAVVATTSRSRRAVRSPRS